ncbi:MAG: hypothetical protein NTU53_05810 [Planctomycetota bacterium]|nr:hypothetical protein [Planctomycetota bacterium]
MKKLAIFAEGGTEQAFAEKLLLAVGGERRIQIRKQRFRGGRRGGPRTRSASTWVGIPHGSADAKYYAQIIDCGQDERVKGDLIENYKSLTQHGFDAVIGIQDVIPKTHAELHLVKLHLRDRLPTKPINPVMVLAIMETEAWFLAEHTHFPRVHPGLTPTTVSKAAGFDPIKDDMEARVRPAEDLHRIYQAVGCVYEKKPQCIQRTVDALDYESVYLELGDRVPAIRPLIEAIDAFLS